MVGVFFRLKWALLRNRFLAPGASRWVLLLPAIAVGSGLAVGLGLGAEVVARPADARTWLPGDLTLLFVLWLLLPITAFGLDETLDPARLASLPLSRWRLATGLLSASLLSIGAAATAAGLWGLGRGVVAASGDPAAPGLVVVSLALLLLACLTGARLTTTSLSRLMSTRRGRDLGTALTSAISIALYVAVYAGDPQRSGTDGLPSVTASPLPHLRLDGPLEIVAWLQPGGHAGLGLAAVLRGDLGTALLHVVSLLPLLALLVLLWTAVLRRQLQDPLSGSRRTEFRADLAPRALAWMPAGRMAAVAWREVRLLSRHSARRARVMQGSFILLFPLVSLFDGGLGATAVLFSGLVVLAALGDLSGQFGSDGAALWAHVTSPGSWRPDVVGRNLATLVYVVPLAVVGCVGLAWLSGGWHNLAWGLVSVVPGWLLVASAGNVLSQRFPIPIPDPSGQNAFGSDPAARPGCLFVLASMAAMLGVGGVLGLVGLGLLAADGSVPTMVATLLVATLAAGYGWAWSVDRTARLAAARGGKILAAVTPR